VTRRLLAVLWLASILCAALFAPFLSTTSPTQPVGDSLLPTSGSLPLGTDQLGRDLFSRMVYATRTSMVMAIITGALCVLGGTILGAWAAISRPIVDRALLWLGDVLLSIPGLLLAMLLVASRGTGIATVILAAAIGGIPGFMRVVRVLFRQLAEEPYIDAARALGATSTRIAFRHILPNAVPRLIPLAVSQFAWGIVNITTLSFLGFTGDPALPEWGSMLNAGRGYMLDAPRLVLLPGLAISLTILALHSLGSSMVRERIV